MRALLPGLARVVLWPLRPRRLPSAARRRTLEGKSSRTPSVSPSVDDAVDDDDGGGGYTTCLLRPQLHAPWRGAGAADDAIMAASLPPQPAATRRVEAALSRADAGIGLRRQPGSRCGRARGLAACPSRSGSHPTIDSTAEPFIGVARSPRPAPLRYVTPKLHNLCLVVHGQSPLYRGHQIPLTLEDGINRFLIGIQLMNASVSVL